MVRQSLNLLKRRPGEAVEILSSGQYQQWRGIRVKVLNGNLDQALRIMERKMRGSGIERMIKNEQTYHLKNSEKRVLARKALEVKIRSQELSRKMKAILIQKVRYFETSKHTSCSQNQGLGQIFVVCFVFNSFSLYKKFYMVFEYWGFNRCLMMGLCLMIYSY